MLDRGVIDEEIAEQRILPLLPERLHSAARGLIEKWDDPIVPVEGMLELLQALKAKGYRLYLLSNAATRQPIYWARAEASKLMDGVLISAEVKLLKPDSQIYRTFLHKFALRNAFLLTIRHQCGGCTLRKHGRHRVQHGCSCPCREPAHSGRGMVISNLEK